MEQIKIQVSSGQEVPFHNHVDGCIGTGRMGLALQDEYQKQLALVQQEIGFRHIRGHGLFCDDMAIYQERETNGERIVEYNFTYLDMVMDRYLALGLKPFLELGFMPEKLASGSQTIFYWKGNTTPPKDYGSWRALVCATLCHLCERYGKEEVLTWPIEVWNEPNLPGFWEKADMQEYFKLFQETFTAIKELDGRFRVGGPAVCGVRDEFWIRSFLEFCQKNHLAVDFVTRHHYTTEFPEPQGHYGYAKLQNPEDGFANLHTTREIIDSFPEYQGLEICITEFSTSYIPNCPLHDTNQNAAYIAYQLSRLGENNASYSYWTFGDIFEEQGVPFTPFHGGFGLVANGCIPKPTFWSFVFFKRLKQDGAVCVHRDRNAVIMQLADGSFRGVLWHMTTERAGREILLSVEIMLPAEGMQLKEIIQSTEGIQSAEGAKSAEGIQLIEGKHLAEGVQLAESMQSAKGIQSAESIQLAEGTQSTESVHLVEGKQSAESVQLTESKHSAEETRKAGQNVPKREYCLLTERVDEDTCNPLRMWHDLGEPAYPSARQVKKLQQAAQPFIQSENLFCENGRVVFEEMLKENAVVYFELTPVHRKPDVGYDYARVMQFK